MTTPEITPCNREHICIDIVDKHHDAGWRIIGDCPAWVSSSQGLHVYRGRPAYVYDCTSGNLVAEGRSLYHVLQLLAVKTGLPVTLRDWETGRKTRFPLTYEGGTWHEN